MIFNRNILDRNLSLRSSDREVMNLRFAFLVTGKYLDSALGKMAYVDDSRKEHCMWKCHGTGDPEELQSDVNLQYFLLVTGRNLEFSGSIPGRYTFNEVVLWYDGNAPKQQWELISGSIPRQYIFSHTRRERDANKQSLGVIVR